MGTSPVPFSFSLGHLYSVFSFLLTLVFVSFIVRSKRPPGSTLAWLLFACIIPYLGIPLYIFLGNRKFQTRLERKQSLYTPKDLRRQNENHDFIETIFLNAGIPPQRQNFNTELITSGEDAYHKIVELIKEAKRSIHITTFILANDDVGNSIVRLLEEKIDQGVKVRILLDSLGALWVRHPSLSTFKSKGGQVAYFMPFFHLPFQGRSNLRNHRKLLIADGDRAVLGGMNIATEYMGPEPDPKRWTDLCLSVAGPSAGDVENIFKKDWKFATGEMLPNEEIQHESVAQPHPLQIVASGPDVRGDPLYDIFLTLIYKATHRVWIATPYFIPDESLAKALELATKRGIDVRILLPHHSNHFLADLARGSYLRQLYVCGGRILMTPKMLHAKAILVDDEYGSVGSANFDMRSLLFNYEVGAFLRSPEMIADLEKWFTDTHAEAQKAILKVGFWTDLAEGIGRVVGPLI